MRAVQVTHIHTDRAVLEIIEIVIKADVELAIVTQGMTRLGQ